MDDECRGAWTPVYKLWFIFIPVLAVCVFTEESTVLASDIASLGDSEPDLIGHKPARRNLHDKASKYVHFNCANPVMDYFMVTFTGLKNWLMTREL
ncbi:hypothetical protein L1049_004468 [Liquidambar formosana]|uniref:Uncharacterized protein n=1 Tax=Liquidambar formosana TaxID=63359 RepID=A0AAP0RPB8_LIQFO